MPEETTTTQAAPAVTTTTTAAAPDTPWHSSIFTPEGGFVDQWQTKLPAEYEEDRAVLSNYKDLKGLAKALKENMTIARAKPPGLVIPSADAPPEEQTKFQAELRKLWGVPDSADGYKLEKPASLPAGVEWSDDLAKGFAAKGHELGLTPKQTQALVQYDLERLTTAQQKQEQEMTQIQEHERTEMARRWGDKVDETLMLATRLAVSKNLPNARDLFDPKHPLFAGVDIADFVADLARGVGERSLVPGAAINNLDPETMAKDIMNNPNNPDHAAWLSSDHPNAPAVRAKVNDLFKRASAQGGRAA